MATYTITLDQASTALLSLTKNMRKAALDGLREAAMLSVRDIQVSIIPGLGEHPPIDIRRYVAGWRVKPLDNGAMIYNSLPYAPVIEGGRRPMKGHVGEQMIKGLESWVRRHGLANEVVTVRGKGGTSRTRLVKGTASEVRRIAWAIAIMIQRRGMWQPNGLQVLKIAMPLILTNMKTQLQLALIKGAVI